MVIILRIVVNYIFSDLATLILDTLSLELPFVLVLLFPFEFFRFSIISLSNYIYYYNYKLTSIYICILYTIPQTKQIQNMCIINTINTINVFMYKN